MAGSSGIRNSSAALLLADAMGDTDTIMEKVSLAYRQMYGLGSRKKKQAWVPKGSLLLSVDGKAAYNYRVFNKDIMMLCSEFDVAPLTDYELQLLIGIKLPDARYETFMNDVLDWGSKLKVIDVVCVMLPFQQKGGASRQCRAAIRWIGTLPGKEVWSGIKPGIWFGIEILVSFGHKYLYFMIISIFRFISSPGFYIYLFEL